MADQKDTSAVSTSTTASSAASAQRSSTPAPHRGESQSPAVQGRSHGAQAVQRRGGVPDLFTPGPWDFVRRMTDEMDRVFDRVIDDFGLNRSMRPRNLFSGVPLVKPASSWTPQIEAFQKGDAFIVRAELPGLKKEDIEVNVTDDAITVQGERRDEVEQQREGYYRSERSYGSFYRAIPLPEGVLIDTADASFKDGVLEVRMKAPPHEVTKGRKLQINEGGAGKRE